MQIPRGQVLKPSSDLVAHHSLADSAAHDESNPGRLIDIRPHNQVPY